MISPLIGINAGLSHPEGERALVTLRETYVNAVLKAGGVPVILPPLHNAETVARHTQVCAGFVFTGGPDIDAARFGDAPHLLTSALPPEREQHDFALMQAVLASRKPVLAICLGCQQMNVALGGTIIQDIHAELPDALRHGVKHTPSFTRHMADIEPGSLLAGITGAGPLEINSSHHQAIRTPAATARVVARATDGIIEAIELPDHPFALGLQWHPEYLVEEAPHLALFQALVQAAGQA